MKLKDNILSIDLRLEFKSPVGGKEAIEYPNLRKDLEPELFEKIVDAVIASLNKSFSEIQK